MKIAVLGGGSWGTTLAIHLHRIGHGVRLWEYDPRLAEQLAGKRENPAFLPGVRLPDPIEVSGDMKTLLAGSEGVVFAVPSHGMRETASTARSVWPDGAWALSASKGLEESSRSRLSQVLSATLPTGTAIAALSGPSHAEEVSKQIPTTLVAASDDPSLARKIQDVFHSAYLRVYTSRDLIGVELGGALKNIIAIAAGILDGLGMGDNTKAALMTRGLHEITRLGVALGAKARTFSGLTGMGDLFVTCMSRYSRNRLLGEKIGKGLTLRQALAEIVMVAEGVKATHAARELADQAGVEVPITTEVYQILFGDKPARSAVRDLFSRSAKPEHEEKGEEPDVADPS